ncbi:MAG: outer membrane protein assembly factor BamE [Proteobacteria bacterium]|jgi:outer membrane protein assembly factor BamE (lipoprotein component of BamABCDE complex)|nr:outer membrane protein assembly factor BamE [Alphaproteobacteria bacterium]NCC03830.1 outer membrane protein assembly factor BamE [Pseudomonadota bacterium]
MIRTVALRLFAACLLVAGLGACSPTVNNRGQIVDPDHLAQIKTGESTREDVIRELGSPTQISTFDENKWYYFGRTTKQYSFFNPEVVQQKAVVVAFNDMGTVTELKELDPADAQEISPSDQRTPTYGHETTILEQLVGNLGRRVGKSKTEELKRE